jgi:hypothetical protein
MGMDPSPVAQLLTQYDLSEAELEVHYPGATELVRAHADDATVLGRLVRVVATNKALVQRGLQSLLLVSGGALRQSVESKPEEEEVPDGVLTDEERRVLGQYAGGGLVVGVAVGSPFYFRCISKCRSRRARMLAKEDPDAFKLFILHFLKKLAKEELRRESLGIKRCRAVLSST